MTNADNGKSVHVLGPKGTWELSVPSIQFFCRPETDFKNKIYF